MEVDVCQQSLCQSDTTEKKISCDIIYEFGDFSNVLELTNVFQLRVNKVKQHLNNLKWSIENKDGSNGNDQENEPFSVNLSNVSLKDQLAKLTEEVSVNRFVNDYELRTISELLADCCLLVSRLEVDRTGTEGEIKKQKAKVEELLRKIAGISFFRLEMLPTAVQKEHEACANDISELHWHIKHRSQIEKKMRSKRNKAADINIELREEIDSIKEYIPLVQEKLELEESMMKKIQETRENLILDSETSAERQRVTKEKHDEANKKTEAERLHIKRDLHKANKSLSHVQKSLQHGEKEYGKLVDFRARCEEKIRQNNLEIAKLIEDNDNKEKEKMRLEESVDKLDRQDRELRFDNKRFVDKRNELKSILKVQDEEQERMKEELSNKKQELDQRYVTLKRTNKQMETEIDNLRESEEKSVLETEKLRVNIQNTKDDIRDAEKRYETAIEEFSETSKKHSSVQSRLTELTKKEQEIEDRLRKTLSDIEKSIKQEISTKANFKTKIVTDSQDLENMKKTAVDKQKQMQINLIEASGVTDQLKLKVAELEAEHRVSSDKLKKLQAEEKEILESKASIRNEKNAIIQSLIPTHEAFKKKLDDLIQREEHVSWQIRTMNSQLTEMAQSEILISKSKKKVQESLLDLEKNSNSVALELEMCRKRISRTEDAIAQIVSKSNRLRKTHENYIGMREEVLQRFEKDLSDALVENKMLAAQYRSSQTDYYAMKDGFLDVMEEQLWGEENVKNIKEVQRLQRYMHNNLSMFFSLKLLYDDDQFQDLHQESGRSQERVKQLRQKYLTSIDKIRQFIETHFSDDYRAITVAK